MTVIHHSLGTRSALVGTRGIGIQAEELSVDQAQWKPRLECPESDEC